MIRRTKITLLVGAGVLAIAGVGAGIAFAQSSNPPPPGPPAPSSAVPAPHGMRHGHDGHGSRSGYGWRGGLLARVAHGEATVNSDHGYQVLDIQRGIVDSANSGQLSVRSADGFTATYVVDTSTKVGKNRKTSDISQVAANDQVTILATKTGSTTTATRISDTGPAR
jgi:hypothetical protein